MEGEKFGVTSLGKEATPWQGTGLEFFLGFILVLVVFGVTDPNKPFVKILAPLAIGLTVTVGHLATVSITTIYQYMYIFI